MRKVWMLILITISLSAHSHEFTHIKLNPDFEQYLNQPHSKSPAKVSKGTKVKSLHAVSAETPAVDKRTLIQRKMLSAVLGTTTPTLPVDGESSPLYDEIRRHLEGAHQRLGAEEVANINRWNQQFNLGSSNYSGFSWQKPFGVIQIYVDRQVTPNLLAANWLVLDTFNIDIEATTFLEKLNEAGLTTMSAVEIGAFAGITFRRVYSYYHYATSYQEGLQSDFGKLFLSFLKFNQKGLETLENSEILKREDFWTVRAGGLITTPPLYNISFSAGALAQYDYQQMTSVEAKIPENLNDERFKINVFSKKSASAGVTAELQLDFFALLKVSLLRYDLTYEYASGKEAVLSFNSNQWQKIKEDQRKQDEFGQILRGRGEIKTLEPFVVRLDDSKEESFESKGSIFIFGKMQKSKTEVVRVIKEETVHTFLKNYSQSVKVVQNFFSRIFSVIVYKVLKLPLGTTNAAIYSRQVALEYDATHPQASDPRVHRLLSHEDFSFVLTQYYEARRTDRWIDRRFKNDIIWFVDNFTTLPKNYKTDIRNELLKGPMRVESNLRVEKTGFLYLLEAPEQLIFKQLAKVCKSKKVKDWEHNERRARMLRSRQQGVEKCVKDLGIKFISFKSDYLNNYLKPSIVKFKDFITKYYKVAQSLSDLSVLFGTENTFINGKLSAKTSFGTSFNTTFSSGQFRGLGVIDTFKRSTSRVPASILSE